jgi:YbgC/YbaW family acyl-CoA thioester hydrolase
MNDMTLPSGPCQRRHIHRHRIAFSECDPAKIVFFANYLTWFDTASREFFVACGIPSWHVTEEERGIIGTPVLDVQCKFLNSATYGEAAVGVDHLLQVGGRPSYLALFIATDEGRRVEGGLGRIGLGVELDDLLDLHRRAPPRRAPPRRRSHPWPGTR